MPNLKKNFRESIFATPKNIPLAGRRRRIFYTAKRIIRALLKRFANLRKSDRRNAYRRKNEEHRFRTAEQMRFLGNLDTALYLTSASGRNLNFKAAVCAEYF